MASIRPLARSDKDRWLELWENYNQFYQRHIPENVTETTFERFFDDNVSVWAIVAVSPDSNEVIGFTTWLTHLSTSAIEDIIYLQDLFVDPKSRNRGAGRALIEHVYAEADKKGIKKVYWHTQHFNHRAQLLYTKVGKRADFIMYTR